MATTTQSDLDTLKRAAVDALIDYVDAVAATGFGGVAVIGSLMADLQKRLAERKDG